MATTTQGRRLRLTAPLGSETGCVTRRPSEETRLVVDGVLPADLDGCFLQARPHPTSGSTPLLVDGIRLRGGTATRFRAVETEPRPCPFGPVPRLAEPVRMAGTPECGAAMVAAWPVPDQVDPVWHTVVTAPGRDHAEHLVVDGFGEVVRTRSFPLPDAPLVHTLAVTARHLVVLDLPVAYRRAADMVGEREPYVWQPGRGARIGLVPRSPEQPGAPVWFDIEPGFAFQVVGAYDEADRVVVDAVWHPRAFDRSARAISDPGSSAPVVRWTLDLRTGLAPARRLTGPVRHAVVDPRSSWRLPSHLFTVATGERGAVLSRHDQRTGEVRSCALGSGLVAGQPVMVPKSRLDEACWLLLPVERIATREQELLVVDAADPAAGPVAVVRVPGGPKPGVRAVWMNLGNPA
jgi:8'-apo-carotenoid 13,14-cleaving dioxygenase